MRDEFAGAMTVWGIGFLHCYPYDNACIESFHSLIKREWLSRFRIESFDRAYTLIFEYIEAFYNTVRIHSHCDYMSPEQFERLYQRVAA